MSTKEVRFPNESDTHYGIFSKGRNGAVRTHGVLISEFSGTAEIAPIRKNGEIAANCHVGLPVEHLPDLAAMALELYVEAMVRNGSATAHARMQAYAKLTSVIKIVAPEGDDAVGGAGDESHDNG